jgi:hypothetical protein
MRDGFGYSQQSIRRRCNVFLAKAEGQVTCSGIGFFELRRHDAGALESMEFGLTRRNGVKDGLVSTDKRAWMGSHYEVECPCCFHRNVAANRKTDWQIEGCGFIG